MSVAIPAILSEFMSYVNKFVTFDILPTEIIYEYILGPDNSSALTENFDFAGYSSGEFIRILGSVFIFTVLKVVMLLSIKFIFFIKRRHPLCKIHTRIEKYLKE